MRIQSQDSNLQSANPLTLPHPEDARLCCPGEHFLDIDKILHKDFSTNEKSLFSSQNYTVQYHTFKVKVP